MWQTANSLSPTATLHLPTSCFRVGSDLTLEIIAEIVTRYLYMHMCWYSAVVHANGSILKFTLWRRVCVVVVVVPKYHAKVDVCGSALLVLESSSSSYT